MPLAIRKVLVIDGMGGWQDHATVLLEGPRIAMTCPEGRVKIPKGTRGLEGQGKSLIPGLIDCHIHYCLDGSADAIRALERDDPAMTAMKAVAHAKVTLDAGITTVRDVGSRDH